VTRSRTALLAGIGVVVVYLAGAALSGHASLLARRPLLDGLAPPVPYRWVKPPPDLAASNKPPASLRFEVELDASGSRLGAFSTSDGQVNLVLAEDAVPPRPGQTSVAFAIEPVDPATPGPVPSELVVAGNAYHIQASYRPSGEKVGALRGRSSVGLVYPLLGVPVADPAGHEILLSADGRTWEALPSTDTPGVHQVSAPLHRTGHVVATVPRGDATASQGGGRNRVLLITAGAVLLVLGALLLRRRTATGAAGRRRGRGRAAQPPAAADRPGPARRPPPRNPAKRRRRR
jgi:hypothetical protein